MHFYGTYGTWHYSEVIMSTMASQITVLAIFYSTVYSGANQRKHQSSASMAFVRGIHWWPVNSRHKGPVTRKMFPFDDVIMRKANASLKACAHVSRYTVLAQTESPLLFLRACRRLVANVSGCCFSIVTGGFYLARKQWQNLGGVIPYNTHWEPRIVKMPTLSSRAVPQVVQ